VRSGAYGAKSVAAIGGYSGREARDRDRRNSARSPGDRANGFTLGLLRQRQKASREDPTGITQAQYEAGENWAHLCRQHALIMGYSLGSAKSQLPTMSLPGQSWLHEPGEAEVLQIRRQWSDCYRALMEAGAALRCGAEVALVCWDVCVKNRSIKRMTTGDFGNLRAGLNALARALKPRR
jgi:hypothetical protein